MTELTVYTINAETCFGRFMKQIPAKDLEEAVKIYRRAYPKRNGTRIVSVLRTEIKVHVL